MQYGNGIVVDYDLASDLTTATPSYTTLGEVYDVSGPNMTTDTLDGSVHGTVWRRFVGGLRDGGSVTLGVRMTTDDANLHELRDNIGTSFLLRLEWPESATAVTTPLTFRADIMLVSWEVQGPHDALLDCSMEFKVNGEPEWADET